jgi:hypothetical protein
MKCSKRSFTIVSALFAVLLSSSTGTLNARDADLASRTFAAAQTAKQHLSCATSLLPVLEANTILRVSGRLPRLHPLHL